MKKRKIEEERKVERQKVEEENKKIEEARKEIGEERKAEDERRKKAEEDKIQAEEIWKKKVEEEKKDVEERTKEALEEKLTCSICADWFYEPVTLDCSHSFCTPCLSDYLTKQEVCPICRAPVRREPVRTRILDDSIDAILTENEKKERKQKLKEMKKTKDKENEHKTKLLGDIQKTKKEGKAQFLNINDVWTEHQKEIFAKGMKGYATQSSCRRVYGEITGLTSQYIDSSSLERLRNAARNVGVKWTEATTQQELQSRLFLFLVFGCTAHT